VVGDDDQSIYGWRGADIRNMHALQHDFGSAVVVKLEENYRSTRPILAAANAVIARNQSRLGKTLRTVRPGGDSIVLLAATDERDEAEWIARELAQRVHNGALHSECAVLYRTNAQSRALEEAFLRAGVPYRIVGSISFYDRREVKDLVAYLRLIANPADDAALLRAVGIPRRGIGDSSLAILAEQARQWQLPMLAAAGRAGMIPGLRPNLRNALTAFAQLVDDVRARVGILGVHPRPSYVSVTFVPCPDTPRTVFAAGFELRDKRPVPLLVEIGGGPARELVVGASGQGVS
jgi:DNA helicase-2/ATP-dependent DNA helicase PcrA